MRLRGDTPANLDFQPRLHLLSQIEWCSGWSLGARYKLEWKSRTSDTQQLPYAPAILSNSFLYAFLDLLSLILAASTSLIRRRMICLAIRSADFTVSFCTRSLTRTTVGQFREMSCGQPCMSLGKSSRTTRSTKQLSLQMQVETGRLITTSSFSSSCPTDQVQLALRQKS